MTTRYPTKATNHNLAELIDGLGVIKARIADLKTEEDAIKDALADLGVGVYEGSLFRLAISETTRSTLDMEAVRAKLSPQFIAAHTSTKEVRTLKVSARNGKSLAA